MKQIVQHLKSGTVRTIEVPVPEPGAGAVLVESRASVISSGTERSKVRAGQSSLLQMARSRPDQVRQVLTVARQQGLDAAVKRVLNRLDEYSPLGYSAAGVVCGGALEAANVRVGDRVACAGGEWAWHAEYLVVSPRLLAPIPDGVGDDEASFGAIASIALHAIHQARVRLGERVIVVGLGLVGQIALQLAWAAGAEAIGVDPLAARRELARSIVPAAEVVGDLDRAPRGADHVIVTAATADTSLLNECVDAIRDRGVITVVGDVPLHIDRRAFYAREAELRIARSYGPGRHLRRYEVHGEDLPLPYVRWSIERNLREVLRLMQTGQLDVASLISERFTVDRAETAYERLLAEGVEAPLALVLEYPREAESEPPAPLPVRANRRKPTSSGSLGLGIIGAGSFAANVAIPMLRRAEGAELVGITSARGLSSARLTEKFDFARSFESTAAMIEDESVDAVVILTAHDSHGGLVLRALAAGKHVFVEKPLTLDPADLERIAATVHDDQVLAVGYNRRHSPHAIAVREMIEAGGGPMVATHRFNAGILPDDHWVHDPEVGGGRIVGELCHGVDTLRYLCGAPIRSVFSSGVPRTRVAGRHEDNVAVHLEFEDGSVGVIIYTSLGDTSVGKEYVEAFCGGRSATVHDFGLTRVVGAGSPRKVRKRDKGHARQFLRFVQAARGDVESPWPLAEVMEVSTATFAVRDSLRLAEVLDVE